LNKGEISVYWALKRFLASEKLQDQLFIHPQVNLGTAFRDQLESEVVHKAIQCKRADFCITDKSWHPVAFVEYQGEGHYGKTSEERNDALTRDEIKEAACREAGVLYHAIPQEALSDIDAYLRDRFLPLLREQLKISTPTNLRNEARRS
jgi:hypothetical protein